MVQNNASRGVVRDDNYGPDKDRLADNYYHRGQKGSIMNYFSECGQVLTRSIFAMVERKGKKKSASRCFVLHN